MNEAREDAPDEEEKVDEDKDQEQRSTMKIESLF